MKFINLPVWLPFRAFSAIEVAGKDIKIGFPSMFSSLSVHASFDRVSVRIYMIFSICSSTSWSLYEYFCSIVTLLLQ